MNFDFLPENFPDWLFIVLLVIGALVVLWLILFIMCLSFSLVFSKKIKYISSTINMLMSQRYDIVMNLIKLLDEHNIDIPKKDRDAVNNLERIHNFQDLPKNDRDNRVLTFMHSAHNIVSICESSKEIVNDERYVSLLMDFNDIEETYRQKSALYNSDIIGFNYWVNVRLCKHLLMLFGLKSKDLIV